MENTRKPYRKRWPGHNLGELINFLETIYPGGIPLRELAGRTGHSVAYVSNLFCRDDMRLSRAEGLARLFGYRLTLFFPQKEFLYGRPARLQNLGEAYPNAGNLRGLGRYIRDSSLSLTHLAREMGRTHRVLKTAFETGDIYISTLYEVTAHLKIGVEWRFEKEEN